MTWRGKWLLWMRAFLHSAAIAGLLLIAASWFVAFYISSIEREKAVEEAMKQSDSLVRLFEHNTVDTLMRFDRTLLLLRKSYEDDPAHFNLLQWAEQSALISEDAILITLIGADGYTKATTANRSGPLPYLGDRPHVDKALHATDDELVISDPVVGRTTKRMSILLLRRLRNPDGSTAGLITLSLNPNFIAPFYRSANLGDRGSISIRNGKNVILAAQGFKQNEIGRIVPRGNSMEGDPTSGHYWGVGAMDGVNRLIAFRASDKYGLYFMVGLSKDSILSEYRAHRTAYIMVASIVTLLVLIAIGFAIRYQIRLANGQRVLRQLNSEIYRQNVRFDAALTNMSCGLAMFDAEGRLTVWNERYEKIYRMPPELTRQGASIYSIVKFCDQTGKRDLDVTGFVDGFRQELRETGHSRATARLKDGQVISIVNTAITGGGWVGIHDDVTARRAQTRLLAEKASELEVMNTRFSTALSNMAQGLCMFDGEKRLTVWNDRFAELYNVPPHLLKIGTPYADISAIRISRNLNKPVDHPDVKAKVAEMVALPPDASRIDEMRDGRSILLTRQPMRGGGWVAMMEDITERRRAEAEIVHLARHDVLTGLANRAEFNARLEEASKRLRRNGGNVTVMMIDLDRFKAVNDTLGHLAGDQLLGEVARRLQLTVRDTDVLARLGGDEFAIIQEGGAEQREGAVALALRILEAISKPFEINGQEMAVGTSIGIALAPENGVEPGELLKRADLALYTVKSSGRNDFRLFQDEMLEIVHTQQSAERELREAIAQEQFELHYQPVVDIKTRELIGVETLVRWRHPIKGMIPPDHFIPLAETTGLIAPLGGWILERACADAANWPAHVKVAINISAIQFKKGNLFEVILAALVKTGLQPERLELEITETSLLENQEAHLTTIRQLKNLGLSIALDDFGTGFSSMNYLTIFPFDKIKIDKSFTKGVLSRTDCQAVVASSIALAKGLGITTTVEGIETEEQLDYMRKAGVELAQGYLFGKPVPMTEFGRDNAVMLTALVA
ncbi:EAL domain-containing protein [Bradyrhizobium sp.]|uniref:EAL domain-containing protein n=1 Tax=Bradyrhizobium sp. TaxID=376 RepID=UPI00262B6DEB|nr:EAL domain-containing protein [Bradyrhizobium sp.]